MNRRAVLRIAGGVATGGLSAGGLGGSAASGARAHGTPTAGGQVSNGSTPRPGDVPPFSPLASLPIEGTREAVVGPDGTTLFVAVLDGFAVVDASAPESPRLLAERRELLPDADGGPLGQVQEVAVDGDRLLVLGPAHPDADAVKAALLYDVSDPTEPRQLAVHRTDYPIHNGDLRDGLAYLTANDRTTSSLEIVDLRGTPTVVGRWSPIEEDDAWADVDQRLRPCHDVIVRDGVAYCSFWDAGTWLLDVRDPATPRAIGHVGERSPRELASVGSPGTESTELPGNHHSSSVDESGTLLAIGHEAWDADRDGDGGPGGITLIDVSSPDSPDVLTRIAPPPTPDPTLTGEWTSAHNFEIRDGVLYSAWYQGGVRVHDVTDPSDPREVAAWRASGTTRFWTAQRAEGAIVAASMGTSASEPGLYTFPVPDAALAASTGDDPTGGSGVGEAVTATPGTVGVGTVLTALGGGVAWMLARRRRR